MMNEPEIIIFVRHVWWSVEKERILGRRKEKNKIERQRGGREVSLKTDLACRYLYLGYLQLIIYSIYLFIIL